MRRGRGSDESELDGICGRSAGRRRWYGWGVLVLVLSFSVLVAAWGAVGYALGGGWGVAAGAGTGLVVGAILRWLVSRLRIG